MEKFNWTREDTCILIENFELTLNYGMYILQNSKIESRSRMHYKNWPTYSILLQRKL
nr:unnamed protein product [Callosobruchus chinensis]